MKQKSIVLFILCALLLFGCLGCGEKAVEEPIATPYLYDVPKLDPIILSSSKGIEPIHTFNIKTIEFVEAFNTYGNGKGALPLGNGVIFKGTVFGCTLPYLNRRSILLFEDKKAASKFEITFYTSTRTKRISFLSVTLPITLDNEEVAKTSELLLNFVVELFEPNKGEQLKTEINSFLFDGNSFGEKRSKSKELLGENSIIFIVPHSDGYDIFIKPNVQ